MSAIRSLSEWIGLDELSASYELRKKILSVYGASSSEWMRERLAHLDALAKHFPDDYRTAIITLNRVPIKPISTDPAFISQLIALGYDKRDALELGEYLQNMGGSVSSVYRDSTAAKTQPISAGFTLSKYLGVAFITVLLAGKLFSFGGRK